MFDLMLLGLLVLLAGTSTLAMLKSRNSQRRNWITKMEEQRRSRRFEELG
jgi:hypothetical protein